METMLTPPPAAPCLVTVPENQRGCCPRTRNWRRTPGRWKAKMIGLKKETNVPVQAKGRRGSQGPPHSTGGVFQLWVPALGPGLDQSGRWALSLTSMLPFIPAVGSGQQRCLLPGWSGGRELGGQAPGSCSSPGGTGRRADAGSQPPPSVDLPWVAVKVTKWKGRLQIHEALNSGAGVESSLVDAKGY